MTPAPRHAEAGFSLPELLVSTAIMLAVTGAIFGLLNPAQVSSQVQPEFADMQQRMRIGSDALFKELVMAGAGPYQGAVTGSLVNYFAPILPRRMGDVLPDPTTGAGSFRTDAITLSYIPNSYSQTTISAPMPPRSAELKVDIQSNCPADARNLCGFTEGMEVVIFDALGNFDTFTITKVQDNAAHIQHRGQDLNYRYETGALITTIVSNTFYLNTTTNQLMKYDGGANDVPLVDNVVGLQFDYYGDPNPPRLPKPPTGIANCLYSSGGTYVNLPVLAPDDGSLTHLTAEMLSDGPYCGSSTDTQFDADLLRIRKVRVSLRMQAASATLRGTDTALFARPGSAQGGVRHLPDYRMGFDVSPRNLNLGR